MNTKKIRIFRTLRACAVMLAALLAAACASSPEKPGILKRTMQSIGLQDAQQAGNREIDLHLHAGDNLNAGAGVRPNAVVIQVYHLRGTQRFEQARFDTFLDQSLVTQALGDDLIASDEIVLAPGTRQTQVEGVSADTVAIGVVALFQAPASNRWKLAFDARHIEPAQKGITIGVHACAVTTASAALMTRLASDASSLVSVRCGK
ncbi:type VI secretion system lipoprotein TssJ [Luteimonas terrae]|uniref:Type VI secretion system protein VasD n=1 Tax=Luteimonas terrae TaxID=1530191 RepID=A0ABU1XV62_9GAMM|nr:type VI secretion system lipoprotein TssJ [Luteimonas terrae]MDR7192644.1 type VI secretion system protein VasD [Luteimonas terrae]